MASSGVWPSETTWDGTSGTRWRPPSSTTGIRRYHVPFEMSEYRRDDRAHRSVGAVAMAYGAAMNEPAPDAAAVNGPVRRLRVLRSQEQHSQPAWRARTTSRPTP